MEAQEKASLVRERLDGLLSDEEWRVEAERERAFHDEARVLVQVSGVHLNTKKYYDADVSVDSIVRDVATLIDKVNAR